MPVMFTLSIQVGASDAPTLQLKSLNYLVEYGKTGDETRHNGSRLALFDNYFSLAF